MMTAPANPRGFTLVELMAAMAIGTIILLAAASLLGSSGESYERVGGGVATEREARALLTQLGSDLSTAVFHPDGVIESSSQSWPADRLAFLSLQPAAAQTDKERIGDLCAVNYYIKDLTIGGKTVRCLMRGFRESRDTFQALESDTVSTLFTARDAIDEPVAFGVVSFEARPKSRDASGAWTDWVKNDLKGPEAFEVRLVIARRELAGRLKTSSDWDGGGAAGKQLGQPAALDRNRYLEVYGALIRFGNHDTI
ncbi:MAG: prepilin-type N-terminal cleavage/methylation domain-containing protein [Akkermansiaceae bacterium]|jgi:prepilin-type N-terminal cleavage/methylation domain-containing protein|nr:prepilin-type N-terminal cleavage/methylation domain-containing protein [Akkermansiaceae bacterium]